MGAVPKLALLFLSLAALLWLLLPLNRGESWAAWAILTNSVVTDLA